MNFKTIAIAAILGLSIPTIVDIAVSNHADARPKFTYPEGSFANEEWRVQLSYQNSSYFYSGASLTRGTSINLSGASASGSNARQVYTWNNNGTKYVVTWRPSDGNYLRVQVIENRRVKLNTLLTRED